MLAELASVNERRRVELVVGWALQGVADLESLAFTAHAGGDDVSSELALFADMRKQLAEYARRHGAGTRQWKPDGEAKRLAEKHGRGNEYLDLLIAHQFVHGAAHVVGLRYTLTDDNEVMVGGPHARTGFWVDETGLFAAASMLHASRSGCSIFGWPEPTEIQQLLDRTVELRDELVSDSDT